MNETKEISENIFKIGAVSRITNIPVDTLRIWERRYNVVVPIRSKNSDRLYQTKDINRLTLLKLLVDHGQSIGTVARLTNDELTERLAIYNNNLTRKNNSLNSNVNIAVIGEVLSLQLEYSNINTENFSIIGLYHNHEDFIKNNIQQTIDILIIEYPAIHEDDIEKIELLFKNSGAKKLLLIYGFTNSAAKKLLNNKSFNYVQAPVSINNLQREISELASITNLKKDTLKNLKLETKALSRTYNNKQLITLSSASSTIKCECPQHLSTMIIKLVQFEQYSKDCVSRYDKDAELHTMLGNMAGHARSILEQSLTKVVEAENLKID